MKLGPVEGSLEHVGHMKYDSQKGFCADNALERGCRLDGHKVGTDTRRNAAC